MTTVRIENITKDKNGNITGSPCAEIKDNNILLLEADCFEYKPCEEMNRNGAYYNENGMSHVVCILENGVIMPFHKFWLNIKLSKTSGYVVLIT